MGLPVALAKLGSFRRARPARGSPAAAWGGASGTGHKGPGTRLFHRSLISPSDEMTMKSRRSFMLFEQKQSRDASSITPSTNSYLHGYPDTS